jgi:RimJ/RimL family protein N-acetyltransferase
MTFYGAYGKERLPNPNANRIQRWEKIAIRTYQPSDVQPYFEAAQESIAEVSRHLPWCHQEYSIQETQTWIEMMVPRLWEEQSQYEFVITDAITGGILGGCGLGRVDWANQTANMGYWVRTSRTRQGVATAASLLLAGFGFKHLGLKRIDVITSIENVPSLRVAEKLNPSEKKRVKSGWVIGDDVFDAVVFSLFPEDIMAATS